MPDCKDCSPKCQTEEEFLKCPKIGYTKGKWEIKNYPGHGIEIFAEVNIGKSENGGTFQPIYHVDIEPSLHVNKEDGKVYAMITYENWIQFPSVNFQKMQEANARLIAASPDLYEALKTIIERLDKGLTLGEKLELSPARQAIDKAGGK